MNRISQIKATVLDGPNGRANAMMIALDVQDPATADTFVAKVAEQFTVHRMLAPADTSLLLITIIGKLTAERFAARWREAMQADEAGSAFMSLMSVATVVQGTKDGRQLSEASLLPTNLVDAPRSKPWWKFWGN